jgi:hypothetical protein
MEYSSYTEAPKIIHFWAGVSAVGGALRRRVWFDQIKFRWFPSFYIIFVGPPGVITKSTTADGSMDLLREVPGIHFGPDAVTWQQLVASFADAAESFEVDGEWHPMSAITLLASEFGNLIDFADSAMVNLFITLWDGRNRYEKQTKTSGSDMVEGPWINLLACTTPQWISANMNANTIGGGFTSRCIFVYGDKKERPIAYIEDTIPDIDKYASLRADLVHDLEYMSVALKGRYILTPDAKAWGTKWYDDLWTYAYSPENADYANNYIARKQAHMHKLALVLAASKRDELIITSEDLQLSELMLKEAEAKFSHVFSKMGRSEEAQQADTLLHALKTKKEMKFKDFVRLSQVYFPNAKDFEGVVTSFKQAGYITIGPGTEGETWVTWVGGEES